MLQALIDVDPRALTPTSASYAPPNWSTAESDSQQQLRCLTPPGSDDPGAVKSGGQNDTRTMVTKGPSDGI